MPAEYTIIHPEPLPLGSLGHVKQRIAVAFPSVHFFREPSGVEKLAARGDIDLPRTIREHLLRTGATIQGDFCLAEVVSAQFYLGAEDAPIVDEVGVELRGVTALAMPFLESLVARTGWVVIRERSVVIIGACSPTRLADRSRAMVFSPTSFDEAAARVEADRQFYDQLGPERPGVPCRASGCPRGAVTLSVFCRAHHFESIQRRPCPFSD